MNKLILIIGLAVLCMGGAIHAKAQDVPTKEEKAFYDSLYRITAKGSLDSVKYILESRNIDLSRYNNDDEHFTPIVYAAAWSKNVALAQYLIDKGADPKAKTSSNETALHRAAWNGDLDMVKLLVENGADLNIVYNANGGLSPLCCAAESGNIEVVKYLVEKGANINYTDESSGASPLRSAAYKANYDIFLLLADRQPADYEWQQALFYGITGCSLDIVKYVVEKKKANVNKKIKYWEYPIQEAVDNKYIFNQNHSDPVELIKYLVSKGAKLTDINNGDVFEWAKEHSTDATIEYLIEQGIPVNIKTSEDGWTPLASALDEGRFTLAKHLIKQTKDYTFRGQPLLVFFADGMYNSPAIVDLLIKEGINKEYYTTAFLRSVVNNDSISAHLLLDAGADIRVLNADGSNTLHLVKSYEVAKLLIEKGADTKNKTMLENAWENPQLLQALEDAGILPEISQENMNRSLANAARVGDAWTVEYMLKRGADINSFEPLPLTGQGETTERKRRYVTENEDEKEMIQDREDYEKPVYKQTPLIKNAVQGYARCSYGYYSDSNDKVQVPSYIAGLLINAGVDVNAADTRGRTALHYAAGEQWCRVGIGPIPMGSRRDREHGTHGDPTMPPPQCHDSIAMLLIKAGADLNVQDERGNTPLIQAAKNRNDAVMKMLLDAGANVDIKNNRGRTMFDYLDKQASFQVVKDAGLWAKIPTEKFNNAFHRFFTDHRSRGEYNADELKALISHGADPNTEIFKDMDALAYTFDRIYGDNKFEIAQVLIDAGIDMNTEDQWGFTLLTNMIKKNAYKERYGANKDEPVNMTFLMRNNIDVNYKSSRQFTALAVANCEGREDAAAVLLKHGAKRDKNSEWWYLLKEKYYDKETMPKLKQLMKEGVNINMQTPSIVSEYVTLLKQKGVTALMFYTAYGREDDVKALIEMGADVNIKAADGSTALKIAKDGRNNQAVVDVLIQAGAKE